MIRIDLLSGQVLGEPDEIAQFYKALNEPMSDKDMMDLARISLSTLQRWKHDPSFPRPHKGGVFRMDFIAFMRKTSGMPKLAKSRHVSSPS
ncbi:MAG: hypothetical protein AABY01_00715 [Nanoarchaeota archaeon]